jgi:hydrogenase/urease accessory protein HupE
MKKAIFIIGLLFTGFYVRAHEVRPAYLGITQSSDSTYNLVWKVPALGDLVPKISPSLPEGWEVLEQNGKPANGAIVNYITIKAAEPIPGETIVITGLDKTIMDVLVNIQLLNGAQYSQLISPDQPFYKIPAEPSNWQVIKSYLILGIDHILLGIDHLLFVLALILVTSGKWRIIKTVTAFTIAHSITLSLAALGIMNIPIPPVEAVIALSIVFLAREILLHKPGQASLTYKMPWLIAFTFGLLHGFGFASALSETGLPQSAIPLALAFFNVGVEVGQIIFVLIVLGFAYVLNKLPLTIPPWLRKSPAYLIGSLAFYWVIDRVLGFWG